MFTACLASLCMYCIVYSECGNMLFFLHFSVHYLCIRVCICVSASVCVCLCSGNGFFSKTEFLAGYRKAISQLSDL